MFMRIFGAGLAVTAIGLASGCSCGKHHCRPACPPVAAGAPASPCCPPPAVPGAPVPAAPIPGAAVPGAPPPAQSFSVAPPLLNGTR